jgi:hypothetical protein
MLCEYSLERIFSALRTEGLVGMQTLYLDSTAIKAHPDTHGASKKGGSKR